MEHESAADRLPAGAAGSDVIDFADLERRNVAVFGQPGRHAPNLTPPVRGGAFHHEVVGAADQISQLRCRIGAMCWVKVTSGAGEAGLCASGRATAHEETDAR